METYRIYARLKVKGSIGSCKPVILRNQRLKLYMFIFKLFNFKEGGLLPIWFLIIRGFLYPGMLIKTVHYIQNHIKKIIKWKLRIVLWHLKNLKKKIWE